MNSPTGFRTHINSTWIIPIEYRADLQEYFLLYHSADYIRNNSWEAGRMLRNGTFYHVVFYGDCKYADIRNADPHKQFALSFRNPTNSLRHSYNYLVPTVLLADPTKITCSGHHVGKEKTL